VHQLSSGTYVPVAINIAPGGAFSMAITFSTNTPQALLNDFKKKIDSKEVVTWSYDAQGDFTHTPDQWRNKAWLRPAVEAGALRFNILGNQRAVTTWAIYGVYHGRFVESLTTHCHDLFLFSSVTSKPTNSDVCTSKVDA
jgi:hypothetical protein